MLFKGQLEQAQLENLKTDPSNLPAGRIWIDTVANAFKVVVGGVARVLVTTDQNQSLTNKSIDADLNAISNIENSDIKSGANISLSKLAPLTASRVAVTDGSGVLSPSSVTPTELGLLSGRTGVLATQAGVETLTNKTISGDNNTIQNVSLSALKTLLADAGKFLVRDVTGAVVSNKTAPAGQIVGDTDAQILDNKSLGNGTSLTAGPAFAEIATPTPPPSAYLKLYPKADGSFYSLNSTGVETKIGAGAGTVNFIKNSDGESTFGWATYGAVTGLPNASTDMVDLDFPITIPVGTPVVYTTTGTNAAPLVNGTTYYVVGSGTAYIQLATTLGGSIINITSAGTGTQRFRTAVPYLSSGGTPINVSLSTTTTAALIGASSFLLTKTIATGMGEGYSYDFTIDNAYKASVLDIKFPYQLVSGTYDAATSNISPGDLRVWILDVTNNVLIQPSSIGLLSNSTTIADTFQASFQTSSNSTDYRLILHVGSSSTPAWSLKIDGITVSPSTYTYGTPITDWSAVTVTGSWTTNTTYTALERRVGDCAEYQIKLALAGAPTAANLTVNLPAGRVIDSAKLLRPTTSDIAMLDSEVGIRDASPLAYYSGKVVYNGGTGLLQVGYGLEGAGPALGYPIVTATAPITLAASDSITMNFSVPIQGWSSSVQMSDSASTRTVTFSGGGAISQAVTANTTNTQATAIKDSHNAWTGTTYVVPVAGDYVVSGAVISSGSAQTQFVYKNGTVASSGGFSSAASAGVSAGSVLVPNCVVGDVLSIRSTTSVTLTQSNISIWRISGPSAIAASETIAVVGRRNATQAIPNATSTTVIWDNVEIDTHGALNTSSGVFTAPSAGLYEVSARLLYDTHTTVAGKVYSLVLFYGTIGSLSSTHLVRWSAQEAISQFPDLVGAPRLLRLKAGEIIFVSTSQDSGSPRNVYNANIYNWISIKRIGL